MKALSGRVYHPAKTVAIWLEDQDSEPCYEKACT